MLSDPGFPYEPLPPVQTPPIALTIVPFNTIGETLFLQIVIVFVDITFAAGVLLILTVKVSVTGVQFPVEVKRKLMDVFVVSLADKV